MIIEQNAQAHLERGGAQGNAQARAQVIRDPASGLLLRVDSFYANASALETDGFDLRVARELELGGGGSLTRRRRRHVHRELRHRGSAGGRDRRRGPAQLRELRHVDAGVEARTRSCSGKPSATRSTPSSATSTRTSTTRSTSAKAPRSSGRSTARSRVDAQYTLTLRAERAPKLTFGAINLFDEDPPRVATSGGYDSKVHDPRGRMLYAKALFKF